MVSEPTVYLMHNQNVGDTQPEPFTVHDVVTQPESSTHYLANTQPDPYSYLSDNWWGSENDIELQYEAEAVPNINAADDTVFYNATSTDYAGGGSLFHDARNDDAAVDDNGVVETDNDYDDEADLDVPSEDDEEPFGIEFSNYTFHDFTASICREGDINELLSILVPTNQPSASRSQIEPEAEDICNWIIPVIPLDCTDSPVVRDLDHVIDEPLGKGSIFYTKEDLYVVVGLWHMEHYAEFKHTCNLDLGSVDARNVRAKAVAVYYACKMRREEKIMKPRESMTKLLHEFGIRASYQVALRARNAAISMIYGGHVDSFQKLHSYLYILRACNPNSFTDLDVGPDGRFRHYFCWSRCEPLSV
ncbi:hypothetical protein C2S53_013100 [Perilla frutescens var. hirtella]|uniref:Uncharacterized protein n=1 Tax=Perilla frutescens var. hirtella TaxID=608512 RepID=A0AAD4IZ67_PERFH|nr:hypothetical protein C2S53_013100 [Perilla frutescens var. hirtella]